MIDPLDLPIALSRNGSWSRDLFLVDQLGRPADISGWSFAMDVKAAESAESSATVIASGTITRSGASTGGQLNVLLRGSSFAGLAGKTDRLSLAYDIRADHDDYPPIVIARGQITLTPGVTS